MPPSGKPHYTMQFRSGTGTSNLHSNLYQVRTAPPSRSVSSRRHRKLGYILRHCSLPSPSGLNTPNASTNNSGQFSPSTTHLCILVCYFGFVFGLTCFNFIFYIP
ncbi:hypothetical protein P170DRAFT_263923 [Aspergillus steynii IBT 23096]|uniref:Uncharacterized protein n=1 Tax=Aspergillus steynii IBT 23096 TaxID=1392250 RepID=A0A2I2G0A0_9EURO|nr:uncharacterized protein P170DRAFT_263923 [Aspergillus steynii IBT 23096]PLB46315.1 hypothetical protein P170DRAFT_263923 [Aspergillus steynii IBT 23096]